MEFANDSMQYSYFVYYYFIIMDIYKQDNTMQDS